MPEEIQKRLIEEEMKESYVDYAMSVIVGRALPDVRDGLKPVHRRVLYTMHELGLLHNKAFKKSANVIGNTMARFHPHGDLAIYDTLVRMAQDFSLRYPLVDGQGNWGCFTADTKVKLVDGRELEFIGLIKEYNEGKRNFTYTVDEGIIKIAEIKNPRLTRKNVEIMKVILDSGEEIKCTLNHKFMLKDCSYKEAKDLAVKDSLMPFNNKTLLTHEAFKKKCNNKKSLVTSPIENYNHKIKRIELLNERFDVYDLTIDKTHNFALAAGVFVHNSVDGDAAAASRYTECRLKKIAEELLIDIDKETVDWAPNYDNSTKEPLVFPAKLPNLLINGSSGIAVGMATNIPPHNIKEVITAVVAAIDNPEISIQELIEKIPAPDFPTGGFIVGRSGVHSAYTTGRGKIILRAKTHTEEKKDRKSVIITEIPYQVNKSVLIEAIADLVKDKKVEGISDIRDESDKKGMRVVIELKRGVDDNVLVNQLFKNTQLQTTFGVIMIALVDGQPKVLNLKEIIDQYIKHRKEVVIRRTQFDLKKAEHKAHILEGLKIALNNIDEIIKTIKASKDPTFAKAELIKKFSLSEIQTQAILEMRLQRLTSLEQDKIKKDYDETIELIKKFKEILASEQKILGIIKDELFDLSNNFSDARKTQVLDIEEDIEIEELIAKEDVVITVTHSGYIKQLPMDTYKQQRRGGKGIIGTDLKEEDAVEQIFTTANHNYILFFSNKGQVYWLKAYQIPQASRYSKGKAIINLLKLKEEEKITALVPIPTFGGERYLLMATKQGLLKKTHLSEYSRPRKGGIIGITLRPGDELVKVRLTPGVLNMILATKKGLAVKFSEKDVNSVGRQAMGVRGVRLGKGDEVIGMEVALESGTLLTVTENGYGKRTAISDYRLIRRGGKGVINIKTNERNGNVMTIRTITDTDEIILMSQKGVVIRIPASDISCIGRNTQGVRIMKLEEGDKVKTVDRIVVSEVKINNPKENNNSDIEDSVNDKPE